MTTRGLGLLGLLAATAIARPAEPERTASWVATLDEPCTGLTVNWSAPVDALRALVGPRYAPLPSVDQRSGGVALFIAACDRSLIDGRTTGATAIGVLLVPVNELARPPAAFAYPNGSGVAAPLVFGEAGTPAAGLFATQGFIVVEADVDLQISETTQGYSANALLEFDGGMLAVRADFDTAAKPFESPHTLLMGTSATTHAGFAGPERATRRRGKARVGLVGDTPLSPLGFEQATMPAILDTEFVWDLAFRSLDVP